MVARYRPKTKPESTSSSYVAFDGTVCKAKRATTFTEKGVARLKPPAEGQVEFHERLERGRTLVLRISYGGTRAWRVVWYEGGRPRARTLGRHPRLKVADARAAAKDYDPVAATAAAEAGTFKDVAEEWIKRYVEKRGLRSRRETERKLRYYVYPDWENKPFFDIRRKEVNALLDKIEDRHGAPMADGVLATIRAICNWWQARDEDYTSPVVRGMRRDHRPADDRKRSRVLNDDELRALWAASDEVGQFGAIVRLALLTGQRREKVATMRWDDLGEETWSIRTEPGEKGNGGNLKLPELALDIIEAQPEVDGNPYVFPGFGRKRRHRAAEAPGPAHFNAWSQRKAELDAKLPADFPHWTLHDLRRTARSLLARARVDRDVAEHLLGHAVPGVEGVYNRYDFVSEKADALARLAALVEEILENEPDRKVVRLPRRPSAS